MFTQNVRKLGVALAVPALLTAGLIAAQGSHASAPKPKAACDGVRLLTLPYVAVGIADVTIDISAPLDDLVICQPVNIRRPERAAARADCKDARVFGTRLKARAAAKATRCLINAERSKRGMGQLDAHKALKKGAKSHTSRMLSLGCFLHTCPGEPELVDRLTSAGYLPCTCRWSVGENIAWGKHENGSPAAIVAAWMASPPHRELILTASMKDVDVGVRPGKPGNRRASAATYTADFGYRN